MIVVSDSSAIICLSAVGELSLLPSLYGRVIIPAAVASELRDARPNSPGRDAIEADWLQILEARDQAAVNRYLADLDPGEAEAVELAIELKADLLLIDDRRGREKVCPSSASLGSCWKPGGMDFWRGSHRFCRNCNSAPGFGYRRNSRVRFCSRLENRMNPNKLLNCRSHPLLFRALCASVLKRFEPAGVPSALRNLFRKQNI